MQPSGLAGTGVKVRIQGQNSLRNGSEPLYVIDGVPIDAQLPEHGSRWCARPYAELIFSRPNGSGWR